MTIQEAKKIAEKYLYLLEPYCSRIEIAGSIRREKPQVKDIEIVCIVDQNKMSFFCDVVNQLEKVKGEPTGKYTQRILPEGITLDLFFADKENWGLIFAIRTGSAEFSHKVLAYGWVKHGYKSEGGYLYRNGKKVPVWEEEQLFNLIGERYLEPYLRK